MSRFGPVLTAMVTPFNKDGSLNLDGAQKLAKYLVDNGNDGLVIAGTTGESATITIEEQVDLVRAVREAVPGVPLVAGAGSNNTASAVKNIKLIQQVDIDALLLVTPYYNKPSQAGFLNHFKILSEASDKPIMLYDVPGRTGRAMSPETLFELAELENIVAYKDANGDPTLTARLVAGFGDKVEVYSGDNDLTLPLLSVGAVGLVGVATHWAGKEMGEMIAAFMAGDLAKAIEINQKMQSSYDYWSTEDAPSPLPSKAMMNVLGIDVGDARAPMGPMPAGLEEEAKKVLAGLGRPVN